MQELARDASTREEEERADGERRGREEEQGRVDEIRRQQEEETARLKADEEERDRRAYEEQRRTTELAAMQDAAVTRAKMEAESKARLAEMAARQDHERQLTALSQDSHKKRLQFILGGLAVLIVAVAVGGGITIKKSMDEAAAAKAQTAELQGKMDAAEAQRQKLQHDLDNASDPAQIAALQKALEASKKSIQDLNAAGAARPHPAGGGGGGGAGTGQQAGPGLDGRAGFGGDRGAPVERARRAELDRIAQGIRHQGALAFAPQLRIVRLEELGVDAGSGGAAPLIVALDELQDPQNFGAILRSSVAMGATAVARPQHH